jgi:FlaA1/EpsC-like NDP-sugar epimerase
MTVDWSRFLPQAGEDRAVSQFAASAAGLTVLVTGAGGYIGSALVKAIAAAGPDRILLLDASEQNLFEIHDYLDARHGDIAHEPILGSVTDIRVLDGIFRRFNPAVVYHAAALKHVALLEMNPLAAAHTNAIGTYTLAKAAAQNSAPTLVLVSTDKAVNPHSIMGASKRLAELTVAALSGPHCRMNAVRLGNVIGSTGSVVPIFLEQIARRPPVTITHPDAARYFMSQDAAVEAILAGGAAQCEGRILLPELNEPQRIADLARFLIDKAAGDSENKVPIRFMGLRPGEKLTEELVFQTEKREGFAGGPLEVIRTAGPTAAELCDRMEQLACLLARGDLAGSIHAICAMVPEYQPSSTIAAAIARSVAR